MKMLLPVIEPPQTRAAGVARGGAVGGALLLSATPATAISTAAAALAQSRAVVVAGGGGFTDNFASLLNWSVEAPSGGNMSVSGGEVLVASHADHAARAWQNVNQIPANWATITLQIDAKVQNATNVSRPILALCFDALPAGNPTPNSSGAGGTLLNAGYAAQFFGDAANDTVARFVGGSPTLIANSNVHDWTAGQWHTYKLVLTKTSTAVLIQRYVDGVAVGSQISDADAARHTGACWVGMAMRASGGWQAWFRSLSVLWT